MPISVAAVVPISVVAVVPISAAAVVPDSVGAVPIPWCLTLLETGQLTSAGRDQTRWLPHSAKAVQVSECW